MKKKRLQGSEGDFSGSSDDWEGRVFDNAALFRLHRFVGQRRETIENTDFEAILKIAVSEIQQSKGQNRVILYAVTDTERFCSLPMDRWLTYLMRWRDKQKEKH